MFQYCFSCPCKFSVNSLHCVWCLSAKCSHVMLETKSQLIPKSLTFEAKRVHECTTNHSKWDPWALRATFWKRVGFNISKSPYLDLILLMFLRRLADFGCHLDAHWILKGSQNRAFWHRFI
jgi:hypothetical protein